MSLPTDVRRVLDELVGGASEVLGAQLVGGYVVGSFALGCADERSDLDVVVVTDGRVGDEARAGLAALHARLHDAGGRAARLDVAYADVADLRSPMTLGRRWPHVADGARELVDSAHGNTAHTRWVLRERGVALDRARPARGWSPRWARRAARRGARVWPARSAEALEDDPRQASWSQPRSC